MYRCYKESTLGRRTVGAHLAALLVPTLIYVNAVVPLNSDNVSIPWTPIRHSLYNCFAPFSWVSDKHERYVERYSDLRRQCIQYRCYKEGALGLRTVGPHLAALLVRTLLFDSTVVSAQQRYRLNTTDTDPVLTSLLSRPMKNLAWRLLVC